MGDQMLETLYTTDFVFATKHVEGDDKENMQIKNEFRVFRDYLGLINLVQPEGLCSPYEDMRAPMMSSYSTESDSSIGYSSDCAVRMPSRKRLDSLDSDKSENSLGSRGDGDISLIFDSISSQEFRPFKPSIIGDSVSRSELFSNRVGGKIGRAAKSTTALLPNEKQRANQRQVCVFCRNNGESREFYSGHTLKDAEGNTSCPILRAYTCPLCKACGDKSHTIKYCPKYTPKPKDKILPI
eukprot:Seg2357.2 transcript_id=Seg2357.2/GoldUCD/mRNA.D3Y31 product="Nanos 1" protein_id=Seg2357.2/GoldUCD/D3Y31